MRLHGINIRLAWRLGVIRRGVFGSSRTKSLFSSSKQGALLYLPRPLRCAAFSGRRGAVVSCLIIDISCERVRCNLPAMIAPQTNPLLSLNAIRPKTLLFSENINDFQASSKNDAVTQSLCSTVMQISVERL